jgi:hypothetical protein
MFAEYVVLFVGYGHSDVVMQYMARAFVRAKERFAFSTAQEIPQWKQLGVRPTLRVAAWASPARGATSKIWTQIP